MTNKKTNNVESLKDQGLTFDGFMDSVYSNHGVSPLCPLKSPYARYDTCLKSLYYNSLSFVRTFLCILY